MSSDDDTPRSTEWSSGPSRGPNGRRQRPDGRSQRPDGMGGLPPELDPRGRRAARREAVAAGAPRPTRAARNGGGRRDVFGGVALGVRVLAALLSLAIIVAGGFYWATFRNFTSNISRVDAIPAQGSQPKKDIDGQDQNILIAGNDDRSTASPAELAELGTTEDGGSLNTDTMMVLHVPANGAKAFAISFPRDSYVDIPGQGQDRLNSAYSYGYNSVAANGSHAAKVGAGARLLIASIQNLTGITIDHFVMVDLISFYRISKAIGGVQVCLIQAQRPATEEGQEGPGLDSGREPDGTWVNSYSGINLPAGRSTISGKQALAFVRQRHGLPGGDIDRIKRQQYFLSQTFRQITGKGTLLNPIKQTRLLKAISSSLTFDGDGADHKGLDPLKLAQQMQNLTAGNLTFSTIPTSAEMIDGKSVQQVDKATVGAYVKKALGLTPPPQAAPVDTTYAKAKTVDPSTVTVSVLNGSGVGGAAGSNGQILNQAGFKTTDPADAPAASAATTITYPAGMEGQAKTLAQYVPGATVTKSTSVQGVTLTLGSDGKKAQASPATAAAPGSQAPPASSTNAPGRTADDGGCIN